MAAGILGQHMRQVHHPARHPRQAAARGGNNHGFSHWESTITLGKTDMEHLMATIAESLPPAQIRRSGHDSLVAGGRHHHGPATHFRPLAPRE
jgi:hypothetical protein